MDREVELKLSVAPEDLKRLLRVETVLEDGHAVGRSQRKRLETTYFDTPDWRLRAEGIALRVRRDGRRTIQTVKADSRSASGLSDHLESEAPLDGAVPDPLRIADEGLRAAVIEACDGAALHPVFASEIDRIVRTVAAPGDGGAIELAFDSGRIRAGRRQVPVAEVELELKAGEPAELFRLARRLGGLAPVRVRLDNKASRGFRLAERLPITAVKPIRPEIAPDANVEDAFQAIARACLAHLIANEPAVTERRDPEGVHQMRVALRRFRSAFSLFGPLVRSEASAGIEARAKDLGAVLGAARDLDIFEQEILTPAIEAFPERREAFQKLLDAIRRRRNAAYRRARHVLASAAYTEFVLDAGEWIEARGWRRPDDPEQDAALSRPAMEFADEALASRHRKLRKLGKRLRELEPEARHDVRKRLKRFRYAAEFLSPLTDGKRQDKAFKRMGQLQDALGVLNDRQVAGDLLDHIAGRERGNGAGVDAAKGLDWAVGAALGWHAHAAERQLTEAMKAWKRFNKLKTFWRA